MNGSIYQTRLLHFLIVLFAALLLTILYFFDPLRSGIYPACMLKRLTSFDCPGCGAARSMHALLHGNLAVAVNYNMLLILSIPVIVTGLFKSWSSVNVAWKQLNHPRFILATICIFWVLRNINAEPFLYLNSTP